MAAPAEGRVRELTVTIDPPDEQDAAPPTTSTHVAPGATTETAIRKNTIEVIVFRALSTPLAFLLAVLQSRLLAADGRGAFVVTVLTVTLFSRLLGDMGNAATNQVRGQPAAVGAWAAAALWLSLGLGLACTAFVVLLGRFVSEVGVILALLAAIALTPNLISRTLSGVLLGLGRVRAWNYVQITSPVVGFGGLLVLVGFLDTGIRGAVVAWSLGHVAAAVLGLTLTWSIWWPSLRRRVDGQVARRLLKLALLMGIVNVVGLVNYRLELYILRRYADLTEVGVYSVSVQVAESLWLITTAIATAIVAPLIAQPEDHACRLVARSCAKGLALTATGALAVAVAAPFALPFIFGEAFSESVGPLWLLLPGIVAYSPVAILTVYLSVRRGRASSVLIGSLVSIVVTAGLAFALIPRLDAEGAAVASTVGYAVSSLVTWVIFVRLACLGWTGRARATRVARDTR